MEKHMKCLVNHKNRAEEWTRTHHIRIKRLNALFGLTTQLTSGDRFENTWINKLSGSTKYRSQIYSGGCQGLENLMIKNT